jgi:hypothetical protein
VKKIVLAILLGACGAQQVKVEPVKVQPIHITVDVNLHDRSTDGEQQANNK